MANKCMPRAGTLFLWALAGVLVIKCSTMQYMLTSGRSWGTSPTSLSGMTSRGNWERRSQQKTGMKCEGAGASAQGPEGLWGTYTLREIVPTMAIFGTIAIIFTSSFNPMETRSSARVMHSIPLTGAPAGMRKSIEKLMPNQLQRQKEQQQGLITGLGLIVPFAAGALQGTGLIPTPSEERA